MLKVHLLFIYKFNSIEADDK